MYNGLLLYSIPSNVKDFFYFNNSAAFKRTFVYIFVKFILNYRNCILKMCDVFDQSCDLLFQCSFINNEHAVNGELGLNQ